jgi:hypothetical protein
MVVRRMSQAEMTAESNEVQTRSGRAVLKVVAYPWGVEFEMPEEESK